MLFPTATFALFFTATFVAHLATRGRRRLWLATMLAASWFFYGWWDLEALGAVIALSAFTHVAALAVAATSGTRQRLVVWAGVGANLVVLGYFKYAGFFTESFVGAFARAGIDIDVTPVDVLLPVGLSFLVFHAVSYIVDVGRGDVDASRDPLETLLYLAFFPKMVAGPILRIGSFLDQVRGQDREPIAPALAFALILGGLFKKLVVSDALAAGLISQVVANPDAYGGADAALAVIAGPIRIYCDFSAYSDIAIGVALLFGIRLPENFRQPFAATSMFDFWRRWHMSLYGWLRDYVFTPLRGPHGLGARMLVAVVITHAVSGLWHGAAGRFVLWGTLQGLVLGIEGLIRVRRLKQRRRRRPRTLARTAAGVTYTYTVFAVLGVLFAAPSVADAWRMLASTWQDWSAPTLLTPAIALWLLVGFAIHFVPRSWAAGMLDGFGRRHAATQGAVLAVAVTGVQALATPGFSPFLYFQF